MTNKQKPTKHCDSCKRNLDKKTKFGKHPLHPNKIDIFCKECRIKSEAHKAELAQEKEFAVKWLNDPANNRYDAREAVRIRTAAKEQCKHCRSWDTYRERECFANGVEYWDCNNCNQTFVVELEG